MCWCMHKSWTELLHSALRVDASWWNVHSWLTWRRTHCNCGEMHELKCVFCIYFIFSFFSSTTGSTAWRPILKRQWLQRRRRLFKQALLWVLTRSFATFMTQRRQKIVDYKRHSSWSCAVTWQENVSCRSEASKVRKLKETLWKRFVINKAEEQAARWGR